MSQGVGAAAKAEPFFFPGTHPAGVEAPREAVRVDDQLLRQLKARAAKLPDEGALASFSAATGWLNSEPLTPEGLRGKVVVVDFWTFTCVNWLRTYPYVRAWAEKYGKTGLVMVGVHTPEFPFEGDIDNVRKQSKALAVDYPIAVDSDYGVWRAFDNNYWPALYVADAQGRIRAHHFGEGAYEMSEMVIQQLLADAGFGGFSDDLVAVEPEGTQIPADWTTLQSGETYTGYQQAEGFSSPGGASADKPRTYTIPSGLSLNDWALLGSWTIAGRAAISNEASGRIAFRFHARDANLVMGPPKGASPVPFRVFLDGKPVGSAHGTDVDWQGQGTADDQRLYQLIRQPDEIEDRTLEIQFLDSGIEAYCFTFG
jgi:thiol-disulfide isomerase/thioredoxin